MNNAFRQYSVQKKERQKYPDGIKLPNEYTRCSYIVPHSSFNSYIDTGLKADINDEYIITCRRWANDNNNRPVFGDGASKTDSNIALWLNDKTNLVEFTFGDGGKDTYKVLTSSYNVKEFHTYKMQNSTGKAWLDGEYMGQSQYHSNVGNSKKLVFMGSWRGTTNNGIFLGDVGEFIIIRSGVKIRHFVPCILKKNTTGYYAGFYDICNSSSPVTGTPFYKLPGSAKLHSSPDNPDDDADIQLDINIADAGSTFSLSKMKFSDGMKYGLAIDWGDGTVETTAGNENGYSHTYALPGIYRLKIQNLSTLTYFYTGDTIDSKNSIINVRKIRFENICANNTANLKNSKYARICDASMTGNPILIPIDFLHNCDNNMMRHIPDSVQTISNYAFAYCHNLCLENLPSSIVSINQNAFRESNLSSLTGNVVFEYLTTIGNYSFAYSSISLTGLTAPNLTSIEHHAFYSCKSLILTSLNTPKLTSIASGAFQWDTALALTSLPDGITSIDVQVFRGCTSLALTTLPSSIVTIEDTAFHNCTSLAISSINAPNLEYIGGLAFYNCKSMTVSSFIAPKLTEISSQAFLDCSGMTFTSLPENITAIRSNAFSSCRNIALESLPKGLVTIEPYAFQGCNKITKNLVMPSTLRTMGDRAFNYVNFDTIRFLGKPDSINIGGMAGDIYVPWSEGEADLSNLNAGNPTMHYDCDVSSYYIYDENLSYWYDGILNTRNGHDPNATTWDDLSSHRRTLTLDLDNCSVETDHLHLNGTGRAAYGAYGFGNQMTIEIVYKKTATRKGVVVYGYDQNWTNPLIYTDSSGNLLIQGRGESTSKYLECNLDEITHFARSNMTYNNSFYRNGEHYETESTTGDLILVGGQIGYSKPVIIGDMDTSKFDSYPGEGEIYCIRLYSKNLTDIEIAHNYNLDRVRFRMYRQESSSSSSSSN